MGVDNIKSSKPGNGKWRAVERSEDKFPVYAPDGQVHGTYPTKAQAFGIASRRQKEADEAARKMVRPCLCCQREFQSEGIHNRLCDGCRRMGDGPVPCGIAPRNGRAR